MSELFDKIHDGLNQARKDKNQPMISILGTVVSQIKDKTVNEGKDITDESCLQVLKKQVKQHEDSIKQFESADRMDLVSKEALELTYLRFYLPKMMSEEETKTEIDNIIKVNNIEPIKKNMGQVMKILKGYSNVDMGICSKYLNSVLKQEHCNA